MSEIAANLRAVRRRISEAAERSGRSPRAVTLIGVSKGQSLDAVIEAYDAGLRDFGENRVQEAGAKILALRALDRRPRWHLVGHLQRNKVRLAFDLFDILHGVDSLRIAQALSVYGIRTVPVLVQVNVAAEPTKFGLPPDGVPPFARRLREFPNVDLRGLMTVAPRVADPEAVRPVFRQLRRLADGLGLRSLSMGMTDDFEVAVEEGATHVRVGRAIFGERGAAPAAAARGGA